MHADVGVLRLTRRGLLRAGLGAGLALAAGCVSPRSEPAAGPRPRDWRDAAAWPDGRVPGAGGEAVVSGEVVLRGDVTVGSCRVLPDARLVFDPGSDARLALRGNLVVAGRLEATPAPGARHEVSFLDVHEEAFRGGGHDPLATDVGLWVVGSGVLDLRGQRRTPWGELAEPAARGSATLALAEAPEGWRAGDELVVCPTAAPSAGAASDAFERRRIAAVRGATVQLDAPLDHDHRMIAAHGFRARGAEVLNLTRDVLVGGTEAGRSHIHIRSDQPQTVVAARLSDLGPQRRQGVLGSDGQEVATPVLGRYGLHFHVCGAGVAGSMIEDVVVAGCGNHAFVAHRSDGLRFRRCVSFDTVLAAYWWDAAEPDDVTHGVRYEGCVAALVEGVDAAVTADTAPLVQRIAGFDLQRGRGNVAAGCRAVGVRGGRDSAGFVWQEDAEGEWALRDCVTHNNRHHGAFVWQNTTAVHEVRDLVSYANGGHGIVHGAYANGFSFADCLVWGNAGHGLLRQANAAEPERAQTWTGCRFDPAGEGSYALYNGPHEFPPRSEDGDVVFTDCAFLPGRDGVIGLFDAPDIRSWCALRFTDCNVDPADYTVGATYPATRITIEQDSAVQVVLGAGPDEGGDTR